MSKIGIFEYMCRKFGFFKGCVFDIESDNSKYLNEAEEKLLDSLDKPALLRDYKSELETHFDYLIEDYLMKAMKFGAQLALELTDKVENLSCDEED